MTSEKTIDEELYDDIREDYRRGGLPERPCSRATPGVASQAVGPPGREPVRPRDTALAFRLRRLRGRRLRRLHPGHRPRYCHDARRGYRRRDAPVHHDRPRDQPARPLPGTRLDGHPELAGVLEEFTEAIVNEGEAVTAALEDAEFGTFDALSAVLGHFNGAHLYAARNIRAYHADDLSGRTLEGLDDLVELLGQLAVTRQTFKTLYMQYELASLSKLLLYVGFPTLLVLVVSVVVTLVFLPFVVLLVYTFRIASIASRTADFGPFVPRVDFEE